MGKVRQLVDTAVSLYQSRDLLGAGIPDKKDFGVIPWSSGKPKEIKWVVHRHQADKAGMHYDLRLNLYSNKAFSWAIPKGLPLPGARNYAVQQPIHSVKYMDFAGVIEDGYGKGPVAIHKSGKVDLIKMEPRKITFVDHGTGNQNQTYSLIYLKDKDWLIVNHTPARGIQYDIPKEKPQVKGGLTKATPNFQDSTKIHQPKIDGSHVIVHVPPKDKFLRVFSYRAGKRGNGLIEHTHKIKGLQGYQSDGSLKGNYRAELYGTKDGVAVAPNVIAGILNSNTFKARETVKDRGIKLRIALHGYDAHQGTFDQLQDKLKTVAKKAPVLHTLPAAKTLQEKIKMFNDIRDGKFSLTTEGVVEYDQNMHGKLVKYKNRPDFDVYVRDVFKEVSTTGRQEMAGGFDYSHTPRGPIVGKVGTGFSHALKKDMWDNKDRYTGSVARVTSMRQMPSGALFQPAFVDWHPDKGKQSVKKASLGERALEIFIDNSV